ncbi:Biofilm regulatory protein A precursor [compost metagenome]
MPRASKPFNRKRRHAVLIGLLALLLGSVWAGFATGHLALSSAIAWGPETRVEPEPDHPATVAPSLMPHLDRPMTLLVMGTDGMGSNGRASLDGNTDTMLLFRLDPRENHIRVVSIPRDTRAAIAGHGTFKINAANSWGGPELAARTVSNLLGVKVDRFFLMSLQGLIAAVDAIGGVEADIPKRLVYHDRAGKLSINLRPGRQHLDGKDVEALLRFRHDDLGDLGRVQRQQGFLLQLAPQLLQPAHLLKLPILLGILRNNAETDLSPFEMLQIAGWLKTLDPQADLQLTVLPGKAGTVSGGWYWLAEPAQIDSFLVAHYGKDPAAVSAESTPSVTLNRPQGIAPQEWKQTLTDLEAAGYRVKVDESRPLEAETQIISQKGNPEGAQRLVETLGFGRVLVAGVGDLRTDYTIHLGADWLAARHPL